ncbi:2-dehydropantoate 2-reductase [Virgibacillus sp. MG-45]|uniref:2-dehydropantoate 2-reductase n=1 Tax=Virgibacillus sp. MG-45 TaxID=3102791 RepID=UPI002ED81FA3
MKIGVIGGGSIGLLITGFLNNLHEVTLYVRRLEQKNDLMRFGLKKANSTQSQYITVKLLEELEEVDYLFLCVKQYHLPNVLLSIRQHVNRSTPLIFLQNGMGHVKLLESLEYPTIVGIVEHGALKHNDYTYQHTGHGCIRLATYKGIDIEKLANVKRQLEQSDFPIIVENRWEQMLVEKLMINVVINPLTALFHVTNGQLNENPYLHAIAKEICNEAAMVLGVDFSTHWHRVQQIAEKTKNNYSSMLTDIIAGRRTEISSITGYIMERAEKAIPNIAFIHDAVLAMEWNRGKQNK